MRRPLAVTLALAACGDDTGPQGPDPEREACRASRFEGTLDERLAAIPCLTATQINSPDPTYTAYQIRITQPVDHEDPGGPTFTQDVTLMHRAFDAPMVMVQSGYANDYGDVLLEPTFYLDANQIIVEHRFFDDSRPEPADWTKLSLVQQAADDHRIVVALSQIYGGPWVTTGISKGGMTTTYHRRFFPDDVDATVPYVAPISFGVRDERYVAFLDSIGPTACRDGIRAVQRELLTRRSMLEMRAAQLAASRGLTFTRIALPAAVEAAVVGLDWAFWQYRGVEYCSDVPSTTASDDALWRFLDAHYPVSWYADADVARYEAYYYQAEAELGYPVEGNTSGLADLLQFEPSAYDGLLPIGVPKPAHRSEAMVDIADWVASKGERFAFIYGEWDPWSGGMYDVSAARDALRATVPMGTHGATITFLPSADRIDVFNKLESWTGVSLRTQPFHPRAVTVRHPAPPMRLHR